MTTETKKLLVVIGFILLSTVIGFYDRIEPTLSGSSKVSVLPKSSVMVIPIEGMIISSGGSEWSPSMVDLVLTQLDEAKDTKTVKAVVLRVNSPGGTIGASQEIYDAILRFKETSKKPVIVSIMDIGASGAYWISLAADSIFSHPGSIVGSLGVITQTMDLTQVPEKYGVNVRTYKAGEHKDILNPWRTPTKDERWIVQTMLNNVHSQFKETLMKHREISAEQAEVVADGRVFSGSLALREGLVDQIGSFHDAVQYAGALVGIEDPNVIYSNQGFKSWFQSFRVMLGQPLSLSNLGFGQYHLMY